MTVAVERAKFQQAAVDHIAERLLDEKGSRRFLLADEVGLGKTIVARGVIEKLAREKEGPLRVVYVCSSAEIADQNRDKLEPEAGRPTGRVTELALRRATRGSGVLLYSFTPGTSLREGTGLAWERRLLLYLVHRIFREDVRGRRWRRYFRCGVDKDRWLRDTQWRALRRDFDRKTSAELKEELGSAWRENARGATSTLETLRQAVATFDDERAEHRRARNALIGKLRGILQRVVLRTLGADLIILDEVQKFRDVIDQAGSREHLVSELFESKAPVLILSATPYKLLTLEHEVGADQASHHEDFFKTLRFLFDVDQGAPARIRQKLEEFGQRLRKTGPADDRDATLIDLKRFLEEDLRLVMCRTERNWYVLDVRGGIEERCGSSELPSRAAVEEYLRLRRGLGPHLDGTAQVTEFWKSAPSLLSFLDSGYVLLRRLREAETRVPRALLASPERLHDLAARNQRLRYVVGHALGNENDEPRLWTAPAYTYHRDQFFGDAPPRKLLVFSGWRFVPKTVSIVTSAVAMHRLGTASLDSAQPLRFSDNRSFHVFDVCFPSLSLANLFNPRAPASDLVPGAMSAEDVLDAATRILRERFDAAGVQIVSAGGDALWRAVARLERSEGNGRQAQEILSTWESDHPDEHSDAVLRHRDWFSEWLTAKDSVRLSEARLRRLAMIAAFSPAVTLLRALLSIYPQAEVIDALPELGRLCFGPMRRFFNRPVVQQIIRRHKPRLRWTATKAAGEQGYAERVLIYAGDAHLQSVFDEHVYVMCHAGQCGTVEKAMEHFAAIWNLSRGSRHTNGARGNGALVRIDPDAHSHPTHFALAFGDDVSRDPTFGDGDGEPLRKTVVREAFNSPFWPFVLATTSVGQEGLDFHLYCRDIMHWNLPSNPVDLEQREGRINRRDCLAVRASIARDWQIGDLAHSLRTPNANPWTEVFARIAEHSDEQKYKHGLYPHWIYECRDRQRTVRIQRHLALFAASRDVRKYARLKTGLALYRLVFGQANQEDLLRDLKRQLDGLSDADRERSMRRLAGYMLNLSPIDAQRARKFAREEAHEILNAPDTLRLQALIDDVARLRAEHDSALGRVSFELDLLVERVVMAIRTADRQSAHVQNAVFALVYLRNPYDHIFDLRVEGGFDDDIAVIRDVVRGMQKPSSNLREVEA